MRTTKDLTIGNAKYRITQFAAREGLKIKTRLIRLFGEPASALGMAETNPAFLTVAAEKLVANLNEDEVVDLIMRLLRESQTGVIISGESHDFVGHEGETFFDNHFAGGYKELADLIREILELNYRPLAEWIGERLKGSIKRSPDFPNNTAPSGQETGKTT